MTIDILRTPEKRFYNLVAFPYSPHYLDDLPGCPAPLLLHDAGHFVQERGVRVAQAALDAWGGV